MHYGDKQHIQEATLQVVIYKHDHNHNDGNINYTPEICSIQKCHLINPYQLSRFLQRFDLQFKSILDEIDVDEFYLFNFSAADDGYDVEFHSYEKINKDTHTNIYFLH